MLWILLFYVSYLFFVFCCLLCEVFNQTRWGHTHTRSCSFDVERGVGGGNDDVCVHSLLKEKWRIYGFRRCKFIFCCSLLLVLSHNAWNFTGRNFCFLCCLVSKNHKLLFPIFKTFWTWKVNRGETEHLGLPKISGVSENVRKSDCEIFDVWHCLSPTHTQYFHFLIEKKFWKILANQFSSYE